MRKDQKMRKKTKITIDPKYILAVIAVVSILMIVVSFRFNDKMAPVQSAVGGVITPMQRGINTIGRKIAKQTKHITTMNKLLKQNDLPIIVRTSSAARWRTVCALWIW